MIKQLLEERARQLKDVKIIASSTSRFYDVEVSEEQGTINIFFFSDEPDSNITLEYNNIEVVPSRLYIDDFSAILYCNDGNESVIEILLDDIFLSLNEQVSIYESSDNEDAYRVKYTLTDYKVPTYVKDMIDKDYTNIENIKFPKYEIRSSINENDQRYTVSLYAQFNVMDIIPLHIIDIVVDDINHGFAEIMSCIYSINQFVECNNILDDIGWIFRLDNEAGQVFVYNVEKQPENMVGVETKMLDKNLIVEYYDIVEYTNEALKSMYFISEDSIIIDLRGGDERAYSLIDTIDIDDESEYINIAKKMDELCSEDENGEDSKQPDLLEVITTIIQYKALFKDNVNLLSKYIFCIKDDSVQSLDRLHEKLQELAEKLSAEIETTPVVEATNIDVPEYDVEDTETVSDDDTTNEEKKRNSQ